MSSEALLDVASLPAPGPDIAQTDLYRAMRAEAAKLDSPSAQVTWSEVQGLSGQVLRELGQDLLAAAFWAHASHMTLGTGALPDCLDVVSRLLEDAWLVLSPPMARIKGRAGAVEWLVLHTTYALQSPVPGTQALDVAKLGEAIKRLQMATQSRLADRAPGFAKLRAAVERLRLEAAPPATDAQSAPEAVAGRTEAQAAAQPADAPLAPLSQDAVAAGGQAFVWPAEAPLPVLAEALCNHAAALRARTPTSAAAVRLLRVGLWLHLEKAPPHTGGITRIAGLPPNLRAILAEHKQAGRARALFEEIERRLMQYRVHLDLQRDAAWALAHMGHAHTDQLAALEDEVRTLVHRVPELLTLKAGDKTPLADAATLTWLAALLRPASEPSEASPAASEDSASVAPAAPFAQPEGMPADAAQAGGRGRFIVQLAKAEKAAGTGHERVALALFRQLYALLCTEHLLTWDSALSVRVLTGFWRCLQATPKEDALACEVFEKIACLDPHFAMTLS